MTTRRTLVQIAFATVIMLVAVLFWRRSREWGTSGAALTGAAPNSGRDSAVEASRTSFAPGPVETETRPSGEDGLRRDVSAADALAGPPTEVLVLDSSGNPVAGASVELLVDGVTITTTTTPDNGRLSYDRHLGVPLSVRAWSAGFSDGSVRFERSYPHPIRVVLEPEAMLRGRVQLPDGSSPGEGLHVVARKRTQRESMQELALEAACALSTRASTTTDRDGRFEIRGLVSGARYDLIAGGRGLLTEERLEGLRPSPEEFRMTVIPGYAYALRRTDRSGRDLERGAAKGTGKIGAPPNQSARLAGDGIPAALLAGLQPDLVASSDIEVQVFVDPTRPPFVGPIEISKITPGYSPLHATVSALPLQFGASVTTLIVEPTSEEWGSIRVRFLHAPDDLAATIDAGHAAYPGHRASCASLLLATSTEHYEYYLRVDSGGVWSAERIPQGHYQMRLRSRDGYFLDPPRGEPATAIEVGDTPVEVDCDLGGTATIEIRMALLDGSDYTGRHLFDLRPGMKTGQVEWITFKHGPYVFPFVPAGEYRISTHSPGYFVNDLGSQLSSIHAEPGERVILEYHERAGL